MLKIFEPHSRHLEHTSIVHLYPGPELVYPVCGSPNLAVTRMPCLQLLLLPMAEFKSDEGHCRYVAYRNAGGF